MGVTNGTIGTPLTNAGAPSAGTDEVQTITITGTPTGGTFKLFFEGFTTATIAYNADATAVDAALEALPSIGTGTITTGGGALPGTPITVTFQFNRGRQNIGAAMTVVESALTGGTAPAVAVTRSTPGVDATGRGSARGTLLIDTTNAKLYIQTSASTLNPTWTVVGTQT